MKGISVAILGVIMLVMIIVVVVPAILIFDSTPSFSVQGSKQSSGYRDLQQLQLQEVFKGDPNIFYNATVKVAPTLKFSYESIPLPMNITEIMYFNTSYDNWIPIYNETVISGNETIQIPQHVTYSPIIIVTSAGNIFFLSPNSSVTSESLAPGSGTIYIAFVALAVEKTPSGPKIYPVTVEDQVGSTVYHTPFFLQIQPSGTLQVVDMNQTVFLEQYSLTGIFQNWSIAPYTEGTANPYNGVVTTITAAGSIVVTQYYLLTTTKYQVSIGENGFYFTPNGVSPGGGVKLTSDNQSLTIYVDGKPYILNSSYNQIPLQLTYGYHVVQFPTPVNNSFDYTHGSKTVKYGQINELTLASSSSFTTTGGIQIKSVSGGSVDIYVTGSGSLTAHYTSIKTLYLTCIENDFILPPGSTLNGNNTPVLGDIAGQLFQIGSTIYGPTNDYQIEKVYFPAGSYTISAWYLDVLNGSFIINNQYYNVLESNPKSIQYTPLTGSPSSLRQGSSFTVSSPGTLVMFQQYILGGVPLVVLSRERKEKVNIRKALTSAISLIIILILLLILAVPLLLSVQNSAQNGQVASAIAQQYIYLHQRQQVAVTQGHPSIFYDGAHGTVDFLYSNGTFTPPVNMIVSYILYFNGVSWGNVTGLNYPLNITKDQLVHLPSYVQGKPLLVATTYGDLFIVYPNQSIGPVSSLANGGVTFLASIKQGALTLSPYANLTTNIYGSFQNYTIPVNFPNQSGTFIAKVPEYVFYETPSGSIVTGQFSQWTVVQGQASLNSSTSNVVKVGLVGQPAVIQALYNALQSTVNLKVTTNSPNPIAVIVDGQQVVVSSTNPGSVTINAGFANITLPSQYLQENVSSGGVINCYYFSSFTTPSGTSTSSSYVFFITPSLSNPQVSVNFSPGHSWYRVTFQYSYYDNAYGVSAPPNVSFIQNCPGIAPFYSVQAYLNSTGYNYGSSYYVEGGKYKVGGLGLTYEGYYATVYYVNGQFQTYNTINWDPYYITVSNQPGKHIQPGQLITINSPVTITFYYAYTEGLNSI